jgi:hypothetical protein
MKINDLNPYPLGTPPATGAAGNVFTDPSFDTPILRLTDEKDNAGEMFANGYSAIYDSLNTDSSALVYVGLTGTNWIANLDVQKRAVSNKRRMSKGATYWSRISPTVLYSIETWNAAKIWRYDVGADSWTLVVDLAPLLPPLPLNTTWIGSRGMSWDDNRFHVTWSGPSPANYVYDVKLGKLIGPFTLAQALATAWKPDPASAAYLFGKSTMDSAGLVLYTADNQLVYNVETGAAWVNGYGTPGALQYGDVHGDTGLRNQFACTGGLGITGPGDGLYPFLATINPANLETYREPRKQLGPRFLWGLDSHTSFRDAIGNWITFNLDGTIMGSDLGKTPIFGDQEIFQFSVFSPPDGSMNRRICHAYSDPSVFTDAGTKYWAGPHASQAQDNRVIVFNSTYGNKHIDMYVAFLSAPGSGSQSGELAGVTFSHEDALALKAQAQWIQSQKKG